MSGGQKGFQSFMRKIKFKAASSVETNHSNAPWHPLMRVTYCNTCQPLTMPQNHASPFCYLPTPAIPWRWPPNTWLSQQMQKTPDGCHPLLMPTPMPCWLAEFCQIWISFKGWKWGSNVSRNQVMTILDHQTILIGHFLLMWGGNLLD